MAVVKRDKIQITSSVRVSVTHYDDGTFAAAVETNWFPTLSPNDWNLDETDVPAREDLTNMEVYGYIEYEVKPEYLGDNDLEKGYLHI